MQTVVASRPRTEPRGDTEGKSVAGGTTFYRQMWRFERHSCPAVRGARPGEWSKLWDPSADGILREICSPGFPGMNRPRMLRRVTRRLFHVAPRTEVSTVMWHSWGRLDTLRVIPSFSGIGSFFYILNLLLLKFRRLGPDKQGCHGNQVWVLMTSSCLFVCLFAPCVVLGGPHPPLLVHFSSRGST